MSGTTLSILGTSGTDSITINIDPSNSKNLLVNVDGDSQSFVLSKVKQINLNGMGGADSVVIDPKLNIGSNVTLGGASQPVTAVYSGSQLNIGGNSSSDSVAVKVNPADSKSLLLLINGSTESIGASAIKQININESTAGSTDQIDGSVKAASTINSGSGAAKTVTQLSGSALKITGTPQVDTITVQIDSTDSSKLDVIINGTTEQFGASVVKQINVNSGNGNDSVTINSNVNIKATINGGSGNDRLIGSSLDTITYGAGSNFVSTNGGQSFTLQTTTPQPALPNGGAVANALGRPDIMIGSGGKPSGVFQPNPDVGFNTVSTIEDAYNIQDPISSGVNGGNSTGGGVGAQVIAIVDVYGAPGSTFLNDLTTFSLSPSNSTLGDNTLPVPTVSAAPAAGQFTFTTVIATPTGKAPSLDPITLASWAAETDLDIEWAHAIAPYATIELFQAASEKISDEMFAVNKAAMAVQAAGGGVVSMSFGTTGEFQGESVYDDSIFYNSKYGSVSFVASAGDTAGQDSWPAMSPYVTSVGGTRLIQALPVDAMGNPTTPYIETPWVNTGGGTSALEPIPTYQNGVAIGTYPIRTTSFDPTGTALTSRSGPDVSLLADPGTGVAIFESNAEDEFGYTGWANVGGTSLSAPMFAGMVALANQQRHINGLAPLGGNLNPAIYVIASFEYTLPPSVPTAAPIQQNNAATLDGQRGMASLGPSYGPFYDIGGATDVTGFKAAPSQGKGALPGFDLVSGWGSPNLEGLDGLVPDAATAQSAAALDIIDLSNIVTGGLTQPIYVPATSAAGASANLIVTGQSYADHSTPPTGSSSPVDIFKGNGSATINPGNTLSLNFFIKDAGAVNTFTFAANAPTNPIPLTEVNPDLFTFGLEYTATGTAAGDLFWIEGTVKINKNNTISVGGDSFRIQGLDFNGNPIPWGKNGPGGAGGDFEIQFTTT